MHGSAVAGGHVCVPPPREVIVASACDMARGGDLGPVEDLRHVLWKVVTALDRVAPGWDVAPSSQWARDGMRDVAAKSPTGPGARRCFARPGEGPASPASDDALYAGLKAYAASPGELAPVSAVSVDAYVARINGGLRAKGRMPLSQGDYPTTRKRFGRLVKVYGAAGG